MIGLIAYGSLMHPDEHGRHGSGEQHVLVPVRVRGFSRSFCQEPSWRAGEGDERGVLTINAEEDAWINAVVVCDCDEMMLTELDRRERGYMRVSVPLDAIEPYDGYRLPDALAGVVAYVGRDELRNDALRPNPEYHELCTAAAAGWGDEFLRDFVASTATRPPSGGD